jgi:glycosyltransferase involved in cell wall biosynthesis
MSRRRTVLHFTDEGDTSGYFQQLARRHDRGRYRMLFATLKPMPAWLQAEMEGQGVGCFTCGATGRAQYPLALARLATHLRRERVDVFHAHLFEPSLVGLAAARLAGTPARVLTRHYSDYHTRIDRPWHVRLDRLATRWSDAVIAVSQHTAAHLVAVEGAPASKVRTIPNGIDFDRVRFSAPEAPAALRTALGGDGAHLVLMVARLHPEKGYEHLFAALPLLLRRLPRPVILLVAGTGALEDRYRALVRDLGCGDSVRFLGFRKDVPDLMGAADLLVLPSLAEAFGLVLAEALYLGTPVVASRVGGIPEIVEDGTSGVLVPPGDAAALADALGGLLADPARRSWMAGAGRQRVLDRFGFPEMVRAYESVYDGLAAQGP